MISVDRGVCSSIKRHRSDVIMHRCCAKNMLLLYRSFTINVVTQFIDYYSTDAICLRGSHAQLLLIEHVCRVQMISLLA